MKLAVIVSLWIRIDNNREVLTEKKLNGHLKLLQKKWNKEEAILKNKYADLQFVVDIFELDTQFYESVAHHYNEMDDVAGIGIRHLRFLCLYDFNISANLKMISAAFHHETIS